MSKSTLIETEDQKYLRDTNSMGLINNNKGAYNQYKAQRAKSGQVKDLEVDVMNLKQDMLEIKGMLETLTEGLTNGK